MPLSDALFSALAQLAVVGGIPLLAYFGYHKWRHKRSFVEVARRAGLQLGQPRYLLYALAFFVLGIAVLIIWSPSLEPLTREGSAQRQFAGLGFSRKAVALALLYGAVQTGFTEELIFRGLIAGSLSRRLPFLWANSLQALIFFLPHLLILTVMPDMWPILPFIFAGALVLGWIRIRSESILGSWLIHGGGNVAFAMMVAIRTS
jgi:membrane protease YdiL (CAAX protease family)